MPYQKLVTYYTRNERRMLHAQGIWVDRDGNQLPVCQMNSYRLEKLVRTLGRWAEKEVDMYGWLSRQPIFVHALMRIREVGMDNQYSFMFELAYRNSFRENKSWLR